MDDTLQQLRRHSENSRTRHKQKPDEKADTHAIALVKAKQYHVCNETIKRKVTYKMLLNIGIFRSLSKVLLKSLSHRFVTKSYGPDEKVILQGKVGAKLFILLHGTIGIHVDGVGVVNNIKPFAAFGERSLLMHQKTSATCFAVTPCLVAHITRDIFDSVLGSMAKDLETMTRLRSTIQDSMRTKEAQMKGINERVMTRIGIFQLRFRSRLRMKRQKKEKRRQITLTRWEKINWMSRNIELSKCFSLSQLSTEDIMKIGSVCKFIKYSAYTPVYNTRDWAKYCYIVCAGKVELRAKPQRSQKKTRVLATISSRMLFGDLEVVPDG